MTYVAWTSALIQLGLHKVQRLISHCYPSFAETVIFIGLVINFKRKKKHANTSYSFLIKSKVKLQFPDNDSHCCHKETNDVYIQDYHSVQIQYCNTKV